MNAFKSSSKLLLLASGEMMTFFPLKINIVGGLPWWRSGWESACQCRGHGFEP